MVYWAPQASTQVGGHFLRGGFLDRGGEGGTVLSLVAAASCTTGTKAGLTVTWGPAG